MKRTFATLIALVFLTTANLSGQTVNKNLVDGEIYVKYHDNFPVDFSVEFAEPHTLPGLNPELITQYGIVQARFSFNKTTSIQLQKTVRIKFTAIDKAEELINYLAKQPFVEYAEGVPAAYPTHTPNDLGPNSENNAWHLYKINALKAWDLNKGDSNIKVAIVDQEFDINHPDLKDNVWKNPGEIPNNGKDDDNNGYIDDIRGWDMADNDNNVICNINGNLNHGTPCAGFAAAVTNNNVGVSSIGYNISFIPIKVCNDNQGNNLFYFCPEGIAYAGLQKADIISCSFGTNVYSTTWHNAVNYSISMGCVLVACAMNNNNSQLQYPAAFAGVIAVAATDINDNKASFSNFGSHIDISAPGVFMGTTLQNNSYLSFSGTSASCPLTAGLLGLMKSYYPAISNQSLEYCLLKYADNIDGINPNYAGKLGSGRINAERSLKCLDSIRTAPPIISLAKSKAILCGNEEVVFTVSELNNKIIDSVVWHLPGAIVLSNNTTNVVVKYLSDTSYDVAAIIYTSYGKDSVFEKDFVLVNLNTNKSIFFDDFEDSGALKKYKINNPDAGITWELAVAPNSSNKVNKAIRLKFFEYQQPGARDEIIVPPLDFSLIENPKLRLDYAFAIAANSSTNDSLLIYVSVDSGKTYPYKVFSANLGSYSYQTAIPVKFSNFIPKEDDDWCFAPSCINISLDSFMGKNNVVLKIQSYCNLGNNLYIDNISVFAKCKDIFVSKPLSRFTSLSQVTCEKGNINYSEKSILSPRTFQWYFPGGTPDTSSQQNPVIKYNTPGTYDVTLITTNPLGTDTLIKKNYVQVVAFPKVVVDSVTQFCASDSLYITASGADSITWYKPNYKAWYPGATLADKPIQSLTYSVKAITKEGCVDSVTAKGVLVAWPPPVTLVQQAGKLAAQHSPGTYKYAWYVNDTLLVGISTQSITPSKTGNYKVVIYDFECTSTSQSLFFQFVQKPDAVDEYWVNKVAIYPNPASKQLFISGLEQGQPTAITITDMAGRRVLETVLDTHQLDIAALTSGVYFVSLGQNGRYAVKKLLVE